MVDINARVCNNFRVPTTHDPENLLALFDAGYRDARRGRDLVSPDGVDPIEFTAYADGWNDYVRSLTF